MINEIYKKINFLKKEDIYFTKYNIGFFDFSSFSFYDYMINKKKESFLKYFLLLLIQIISSFFYKKNKINSKIIFFPFTNNQYENFKPLFSKLNNCYHIILKNTFFENFVYKLIYNKSLSIFNFNKSYKNYSFLFSFRSILILLRSLFLFLKTYINLKQKERKIYSNFQSLLDYNFTSKKKLSNDINSVMVIFSYNLALFYLIENCFKVSKPKLVIVGNEFSLYGKVVVRVANAMYIKTINVPHSMVTCNPSYWEYESNYVILQGQHDKDYLINKGYVNKDKLKITGRPLIEEKLLKNYNKEEIKKELCLQTNRKVICIATQPLNDKIRSSFIYDCFNAFDEINDKINIIIKIHPDEKENFYQELLFSNKYKKFNFKIIRNYDLYSILTISNLLISICSNVGSEALFKNVPSISYNKWNLPPQTYVTSGYIKEIKSVKTLKKEINNLLYNKKIRNNFLKTAKEYTKYMNYKLDGKSTERIINEIKKLL